jgi:thiosulfate/3-mercaptopyruvate sulfurtransferase
LPFKRNLQRYSVGAGAAERLVDARPKPRWAGEAPEPRAGIRSGRVPGSSCVPFFDLLNEDKTYKAGLCTRRIQ